MKKWWYNKIERRILRIMYQHKAILSAYEISKLAGISYVTAVKYLGKLEKEGVVKCLPPKYGHKKETKNK